jgi:Asp-tRNA(Asn)/Glu-tRNA(Gln) amidotransferase A subunit family amidase
MRGYIDWGAKASAVRLLEAEREMDRMAFAVPTIWTGVDAVISPATPQTAFAFSAKVPDNQGAFCVAANISGCPAISIPAGLSEQGLPVGLHLMAPLDDDLRLLGIAAACEAALGPARLPPPPFGPAVPICP